MAEDKRVELVNQQIVEAALRKLIETTRVELRQELDTDWTDNQRETEKIEQCGERYVHRLNTMLGTIDKAKVEWQNLTGKPFYG
jgi:adenylosuccinate synthase